MGFSFKNFWNGLRLVPSPGDNTSQEGDLQVNSSTTRLIYNNGSGSSPVVTDSSTDTLTNKTLNSAILNNPIINGGSISPSSLTVKDGSFIVENTTDNTKQFQFDGSAISPSTDITLQVPPASTILVGTDSSQTLTNKTITGALIGSSAITNSSFNGGNIQVQDLGNFLLENTFDATKQLKFDLSGLSTSTSVTYHVQQDHTGSNDITIVGTDTPQTLTNKTIDIPSNTITGILPIANGGTNASTKTPAFDNLSPTTTKGDLIVNNGTNNIRIGVGVDGQILTANSAQPSGVSWSNAGALNPPTQQIINVANNLNPIVALYVIPNTPANATVGATYTNNGHTFTVLNTITNANTQVLFLSPDSSPLDSGTPLVLSTGSGDASISFGDHFTVPYAYQYTTPTSPAPLYLRIRMCAGGGGGSGSGSGSTPGENGLDTIFSPDLICFGGQGGNQGSHTRGAGGTFINNLNPYGGFNGGDSGAIGPEDSLGSAGGNGGTNPFGGGGAGGSGATPGFPGVDGAGAGGGGGGWPGSGTELSGAGGGAGGYIEQIIPNPAANYYFVPGNRGSQGITGSGGEDGATGGYGNIIIDVFYQ